MYKVSILFYINYQKSIESRYTDSPIIGHITKIHIHTEVIQAERQYRSD